MKEPIRCKENLQVVISLFLFLLYYLVCKRILLKFSHSENASLRLELSYKWQNIHSEHLRS